MLPGGHRGCSSLRRSAKHLVEHSAQGRRAPALRGGGLGRLLKQSAKTLAARSRFPCA